MLTRLIIVNLLFSFMFILPVRATYNPHNYAKLVDSESAKKYARKSDDESEVVTLKSFVEADAGVFEFEIHAPESHIELAKRSLAIIHNKAKDVLNHFEYIPQTTVHFIIKTSERDANGAATVFPYNLIWLFDFPPEGHGQLSGNYDWLEPLIVHELTHVVHLDMTTGFLQGLRYVFGSTAKLAAIMPRWFIEGLAVWIESRYTDYGRLKDDRIRLMFADRMTDQNFCSTIDCLDSPGDFPYGGYAYWGGAYFLEYVEKQYKGSLACIVKENSDSIPFFLNRAFRACTAYSATEVFNQFRRDFLTDYYNRSKTVASKYNRKSIVVQDLLETDLFNNSVIMGAFLFTFSYKEKTAYLERVNLKTGKSENIRLAGRPSEIKETADRKLAVRINLRDGKESVKRVDIYNPKDLSLEWSIPEDFDLYLPYKRDWLYAFYKDSTWNFYLRSDYDEEKDNVRYELPYNLNAQHFFTRGDKLFFLGERVNAKVGRHFIASATLEKEKQLNQVKVYYSSNDPINYQGQCHNKILVREKKGRQEVLSAVDLSSGKVDQYRWPDESIVYWIPGESYQLFGGYRENHVFYSEKKSCKNFLRGLVKLKTRSSGSGNVNLVSAQKASEIEVETYPSLRHFRPYHLFFSYNNVNNLDSFELSTSLTDPLSRHRVDMSGTYYTDGDEDELSPGVSYRYTFSDFAVSTGYYEYHSRNSFATSTDRVDSTFVTFGYSTGAGNFVLNNTAFGSRNHEKDFLSKRESIKTGVSSSLLYLPTFATDFVLGSAFHLRATHTKNEVLKNYAGVESAFNIQNRWSELFKTRFRTSYGKLFKDDLISGVMYGGGASSNLFGGDYLHEFYPLPYADAYGNEIQTAHLEGAFQFRRSYRGAGLFPLFFKTASAVFGTQWLAADRIWIDNQIRRDESLIDVFLGARFDVMAAYLLPLEVDIIFSHIIDSDIDDDKNSLSVLIKGSLF